MKKNTTSIIPILLVGIISLVVIAILSLIGQVVFNLLSNSRIYLIYILICLGSILFTNSALSYINYHDIKLINKRLEEEYKKKNGIEYYRDKIKNYSPDILAYCYNKKIDYKKVFIASILDLSQRKYITITDNDITILNDNYNDLNENEILILEAIKHKRLPETYRKIKKIYISITKKDAIKKGIIAKIDNYDTYQKTINIIFSIFFISIFCIAFLNLWGVNISKTNGLKEVLTYFFAFLVGTFISYINRIFFKNAYKKTEKGIDLSVKVKCLKKFISEFTDLKNQQISSIKLWDEYIVYVLLLDVDGKINKEVKLFTNKYLK